MIDPVLSKFHADQIKRTRATLFTAKADFEARKKAEWQTIKEAASKDTYAAVWAAKDAGMSVVDIAANYGVSNRSVIYNILKERIPEVTEIVEKNAPEPENAIQVEHVEGTVYRITLPDGTWFTTWAEPNLDRTKMSQAIKQIGTAKEHRAELLDNTHPVWATLAAAQTN